MKLLTASCVLFLFQIVVYAKTCCKSIPGDSTWPNLAAWQQFNNTINGQLISTVPLPSVCHLQPFGTYSVDACADTKTAWVQAQTFYDHSAEVMNPYFQNQSCSPYTASSQPCELGNYASYSVNVTGPHDVIEGIKFAKEHNIRIVIKNTGHDFAGKSTGKGSLSLWTHNLNTTQIIKSYSSSYYTGPAVKLGAGVVGLYVYSDVGAAGYRVIGGTCPTVGLAGGYTSGGGHSLLNGLYGMAADAALEWEVITAQGEHLIATPTRNSDLYWALSGGGAGTFAVVLSLTTRIFPDGLVGSGSLNFNANQTGYWDAIEDLWEFLPGFVANGSTWDFALTPTGFQTYSITVDGKNSSQVQKLMQPYLSSLNSRGIAYTYVPDQSATYADYFLKIVGPGLSEALPANVQLASRLIPRAGVLNSTQNKVIVEAMRAFTDAEYWSVGCHAMNVESIAHPDNAVLPQWRKAVANCNIVSYWDWNVAWSEMQTRKQLLVNTLMPGLEQATPGSGTYLNEIDAQWKGDWKTELYAGNYAKLLEVKEKYDPGNVFYAWTSVGSDSYTVDGSGRLCGTEIGDQVCATV